MSNGCRGFPAKEKPKIASIIIVGGESGGKGRRDAQFPVGGISLITVTPTPERGVVVVGIC